ncbi:hypothetical protein GCM10010112_76900 [Actinoplanes lobatus]|uniref:Uncharacterized protein n=1 Tax=Actinoplanes lobatus TaxID=113568 RepID=A0ABQ4AS88_9ACTN|nr:hypothetical protein GCM10010112_76900 [Actinoplanes lobatus]GIE43882.1 hypothetical protein Alo02nite_67800 [Actinoplanes lobatus]
MVDVFGVPVTEERVQEWVGENGRIPVGDQTVQRTVAADMFVQCGLNAGHDYTITRPLSCGNAVSPAPGR